MDSVHEYSFRKRVQIPEGKVCLIAPSVTRGGFPNGFLFLDTELMEAEAVRI
jgi:hypothetical protein